MSWRLAAEADRGAVEAFLGARADTSMFPLSNLARHGMAGGHPQAPPGTHPRAHPRAMSFLILGDPLRAALGVSEGGVLMPQVPPEEAGGAARALRAARPGLRLRGLLGESAQVAALRGALGLDDDPAELDHDEPRFALDLAELRMPPVAGLSLAPLDAAPEALLVAWRAAYGREVLGWEGEAEARAAESVAMERAAGQHRVLLRDGEPVAGTGFNARLPSIAQVGGVWTPPEHRGQGLARAAVALHLAEARGEGVGRAVLFSASEAAARAYRAIGFREGGRFTLLMFPAPVALP